MLLTIPTTGSVFKQSRSKEGRKARRRKKAGETNALGQEAQKVKAAVLGMNTISPLNAWQIAVGLGKG